MSDTIDMLESAIRNEQDKECLRALALIALDAWRQADALIGRTAEQIGVLLEGGK